MLTCRVRGPWIWSRHPVCVVWIAVGKKCAKRFVTNKNCRHFPRLTSALGHVDAISKQTRGAVCCNDCGGGHAARVIMSLEGLPLECQRNVLDRLHWVDVCSVAMVSRALRDVSRDEYSWEHRCRERFTGAELEHNACSASTSDANTWRAQFAHSVSRARHGARLAKPLLAVPDNQRVHFTVFSSALAHLNGMSQSCFGEFIASDPESSTLLITAGVTEIMARMPKAKPNEVTDILENLGTIAARKVRLQLWTLGRLDGTAPFRLRDDTAVHEGTLLQLIQSNQQIWPTLLRGIKHEVRDMEIESVGPKEKSFWGGLGVT